MPLTEDEAWDMFWKDCVISAVSLGDGEEIEKSILHMPSGNTFTAKHKRFFLLQKEVEAWALKIIKELEKKNGH